VAIHSDYILRVFQLRFVEAAQDRAEVAGVRFGWRRMLWTSRHAGASPKRFMGNNFVL
jgi:hypothetical protein